MSNTNSMKKTVLASALVMAFAAGMSSVAFAQTTVGSVGGQAVSGSTITIENKALGLSRQITVDKDGGYQVGQLPPGSYTVKVKYPDGSTEDRAISVAAGVGATANFTGAKETQVVVTGRLNTIDVKSPESTTVFGEEKIDRIPVLRDVTAVALLAPGAVVGDNRIGQTTLRGGNVPSLGGASAAENAYFINGFNVTNMVNGVAYNTVPFEAIAQQQVKTGGYGAEYGRSLGGVLSITTKRGTNEWHGGANVIYTPKSFESAPLRAEKSTVTGDWMLTRKPGGTDDLKTNIWAGGPLIEDKLFVFGLIQGANVKRETTFVDRVEELKSSTPQYLAKIDWNINSDNLLEFTAFSDKAKDKQRNWRAVNKYDTTKGAYLGEDVYTTGGTNYIAKYTTWINEDLTVSAMYGHGKYNRNEKLSAGDCPLVRDDRASPVVRYGCSTATAVNDPNAGDQRKAFRLDAEWQLGAHQLRFGLDNEEYKVIDASVSSGGASYIINTLRTGGQLDNGYVHTGPDTAYVDIRHFANGGQFKNKNKAFYIEDNYQVTKNILASIGVRSEGFNNLNASGASFVKVDNTIAPRLGVTWDVNGDASMKVFGNAGRYYIPVMSNTNVRLAGAETDYHDFYVWNGTFTNDRYQLPVLGQQLGSRLMVQNGTAKDPRTVVDPNLKPMYQDEFIVGMQKALANRWSVGAKYTHRKLKSVMDDVCGGEQALEWALANGYTQAQADAIAGTVDHCFLYNPGKDLTANVDLGDGKLTPVTIPAAALKFPQPKRTYDALELTFERPWDGKWSLQGSYVLAFSKGNAEGYVKSDTGQDDAGLTTDWDYPGLMEGSDGYLPNDRRHTFKLFGSYQVADEWRFGANLMVQSGRPKNCLGYYAGNLDTVSIQYGAVSFWCLGKLVPRGTAGRLPWTRDLGLQLTYTPKWQKGLMFQIDVLNVLNENGLRSVLETGERPRGTPGPRYGEPWSWQPPRKFRFTAQYEF
ncbi:MAG TPA: TonB-dependent receptor [Paucimonas sp.]|nr:TonB-dependent receptor [Paucimonas sp.]